MARIEDEKLFGIEILILLKILEKCVKDIVKLISIFIVLARNYGKRINLYFILFIICLRLRLGKRVIERRDKDRKNGKKEKERSHIYIYII